MLVTSKKSWTWFELQLLVYSFNCKAVGLVPQTAGVGVWVGIVTVVVIVTTTTVGLMVGVGIGGAVVVAVATTPVGLIVGVGIGGAVVVAVATTTVGLMVYVAVGGTVTVVVATGEVIGVEVGVDVIVGGKVPVGVKYVTWMGMLSPRIDGSAISPTETTWFPAE